MPSSSKTVLDLWETLLELRASDYLQPELLDEHRVTLRFIPSDPDEVPLFSPCFFVPRAQQFLIDHPIDMEQFELEPALHEELEFRDLGLAEAEDPDLSPIEGAYAISDYFSSQIFHVPRVGAPDSHALSLSQWHAVT
jgi:hypothetical protein